MADKKSEKIRMRVRRGDNVVVISGRDKGKTGEVLRVDRERNRVLVQGVNIVKRHQRPTQTSPGGINDFEAMIHASNISLVDPKTDKPTRVGFKTLDDGRKVRVAMRSGEVIDSTSCSVPTRNPRPRGAAAEDYFSSGLIFCRSQARATLQSFSTVRSEILRA